MMDLSVIVPVYNVEPYLDACISSLYEQSFDICSFEVILVNDGSTDRSREIVESWKNRYSNIQVIDQKNQGLSVARNEGLLHASGDFICFLDSDDFLYPDTLPVLLEKAKVNNLDILRFDYWVVDEQGTKIYQSPYIHYRESYADRIGDGMFLFEKIYHKEFFAWLSLFKRSFLLDSQVRFAPGMFFEDIEYTFQLSLCAKRTMYVPSCAYGYRQRATSILHTFSKKKAEDVICIVSNLQHYLENPTLSPAFKEIVKQQATQLMVSVLLRIAETAVYSDRQELFELMKKKNVLYLYPDNTPRNFIISTLYNRIGKHVIYFLYPVARLRGYLLRLKS